MAGDALTYEAARSLVLAEARTRARRSRAPATRLCLLRFDTVIIDEAAQAVEVSTRHPLKYSCRLHSRRRPAAGDGVFRALEGAQHEHLFERLRGATP